MQTTIFAPSIVYDPGDRWVRLLKRLALLPAIPISGSGRSAYQPIWAADVARCVISALERDEARARYELAGPEVLTYDEIALTVARAAGRERPLVHVPLGLVHLSLVSLRRVFGDAVFATWEEAELMEVPMTTPRGTADAESLGVEPVPVRDVLAAPARRHLEKREGPGAAGPFEALGGRARRAYHGGDSPTSSRPCRACRRRGRRRPSRAARPRSPRW